MIKGFNRYVYDNVIIYAQYTKIVAVVNSINYHKIFKESNIISIAMDEEVDEMSSELKEKYHIIKLSDLNVYSNNNIIIYEHEKSINKLNINFSYSISFEVFIRNECPLKVRKEFDYKQAVYMHIVDSCNWGCKGCTHFAPLVPKHKIYTFDEIKSDVDLIYETITPKRVYAMRYLGGEPLLNPDIEKILRYTREKMPDLEQIEILSNGFLLKKMPQSFYDTCNECDVSLAVSKYNVPNFDYDKLKEFIADKGRDLRIAEVKRSLNLCLQKTPRNNSNMFYRCGGGSLLVVHNGAVNPCFTAEFGYIFKDYFGYDFMHDEKPFLLNGHDFYEIYDSLWTPREFCKHCFNTQGGTFTEWQRSKRDISEWVCEDFENS